MQRLMVVALILVLISLRISILSTWIKLIMVISYDVIKRAMIITRMIILIVIMNLLRGNMITIVIRVKHKLSLSTLL